MSILSRLFGGKAAAASEPVQTHEHKGYVITPEPIREGNQFRLAARIEKTVEGETKVHHLIRADTIASRDEAAAAALNKARQVIDEQGDRIFG